MLPLLGGLITGGASLLGNIFSSQTSAANTQAQIASQQNLQAQSEEFNANQAAISRDWNAQAIHQQEDYQTGMSNTAYQRASADMKAAGLNPMMMFGSGGAASTPSGSMASSPTASVGTPSAVTRTNTSPFANLGENVAKAVSSAVSMKQMDMMTEEIAKLKTGEALDTAHSLLTGAQQRTEEQRPALVSAETGETTAREAESRARAGLTGAQKANVEQDTTRLKLDRARQEWDAMRYIDLSGIPDAARKTGNIGGWGAGKIGEIIDPLIAGTGTGIAVRRMMNDIKQGWASTHSDTRFGKGFSTTETWRQ